MAKKKTEAEPRTEETAAADWPTAQEVLAEMNARQVQARGVAGASGWIALFGPLFQQLLEKALEVALDYLRNRNVPVPMPPAPNPAAMAAQPPYDPARPPDPSQRFAAHINPMNAPQVPEDRSVQRTTPPPPPPAGPAIVPEASPSPSAGSSGSS